MLFRGKVGARQQDGPSESGVSFLAIKGDVVVVLSLGGHNGVLRSRIGEVDGGQRRHV